MALMPRIVCSVRAAVGAATIAFACPSVAAALQADYSPPAKPESVTVAAGKRYEAGAFRRWLSGNTYRDLWVTPIRVPVLDWRTYAGGLQPTKEGGGMQTKSLRFEATNGAEYVFRLSDKSVTSGPEQLKNTPADAIFQDEVSALHPAAAQISAPILAASGVLHPTAVLMVMPDDSALGKYRGDFEGRLGMIEEYPNVPKSGPGFGGATKIIDSEELLKLLNADPAQHVDARAFLVARLTDFLINDNDRHPGNWKWARLESGPKTQWQPIARDRDHAFVSYGGVLARLARIAKPSLVSLGSVPHIRGLTQPRMFDARLLAGLEKPVWDSIARALQARITDSVIATAAHAIPLEYQASAPRLETVLRNRRDALPNAATEYYRELAARVEVHGTDAPDRAVITRSSDGVVDVRMESEGKPFFARRFDARETSEILLYLHNGDDTAYVTGHVERSITIRVIGGNGTNTLIDSSTVAGKPHTAHLYDAGTTAGVTYGLDTLFDRRPWEKKNGALVPPEIDEGAKYLPIAGLSFQNSIGITPRVGVVRYGYGFAQRPYASMVKLEGEYGIKYHGFRVGVSADKRLESSPVHFMAVARMSDLEVVNFHGFGNAAIDSGDVSTYFEVHQRQWLFHPAIALAIGSRMDISLGPVIQHSGTDSARSRYLSATQPYGFGTFTQAGMQLGAQYQWRDVPNDEEHTHHRVLVEVIGRYFAPMMDVRSAFESAAITIGTSLTLPVPTHPLLVARAGGKKLYGDFPFSEAATIGGDRTTRYMDTQRYAGDASLYATSELRVPLVHFQFVIPLRMGIVGLAEAGRVYEDGSSPGGWHSRTGEGIWVGRGDASPVVTFARTTEPGRTGVRVRLGLNF
jgi:hypothetical protein